ncbi:MAG: hypothetical protein HYV07_14820 [Deltaproteobacteria bacterium]|nr:hypothetical protein [Deltaproteobacteria bacterium]
MSSQVRSAGFVERRLDQWLEQKKLEVGDLAGGNMSSAAADLGFSVDELQKARQALVARAAESASQGSNATKALALGAGSSVASSGSRIEAGPMGVRFGLAASASFELATVPRRFDELADKLRRDPQALRSLAPSFASLASSLSATIKDKEEKLAPLADRLAGKEEKLNWFQRNVGLFTPRDVRELRGQVGDLQEDVGRAKAFRGGTGLALRLDRGTDADLNPAIASQKLASALAGVPSGSVPDAARKKGVAGLVKAQDQIRNVTDRANLDQRAIDGDLSDFNREVKWHQKWKWVDVIIGGESGRGALLRMGKELDKSSEALVGDLEKISADGEHQTLHHLNELLKLESPKYREMRAMYDKLEPAYRSVTDTLHAASEAQDALESAEYWIDRRNMLKLTEPAMYETVYDRDEKGNTTSRQVESSAHQSWESQYNHANWQAQWESSRAESEVKQVNGGLPRIQESLAALGGPKSYIPPMQEDIGAFWGQFSSFGFWSFDSSNVDQMQNQLRKLEGTLHEIKGRLEPDYNKHKSWVFAELDKRRGELRAEA